MSDSSDSYPDSDFPWNFYFNGVLMPKWGASWILPPALACGEDEYLEDIGVRDLQILGCRIDHVGVVESADPQIFMFCIQKLLLLYLEHQDAVLAYLRDHAKLPAEEVFSGVVNAAFQMRRLVSETKIAFWTSGYEADRQNLIERMDRFRLPRSDPRFQPAPHIEDFQRLAQRQIEWQQTKLRGLAQSRQFSKEWRAELHQA